MRVSNMFPYKTLSRAQNRIAVHTYMHARERMEKLVLISQKA